MENKSRYISPASFWSPDYLPVSAWVSHGPFAFWLTEQLRPRRFVELGAHYGYSYFSICQAIKRLELGTTAYAVDTWQGDEHAGFYNDDVFLAVNNQNSRYAEFSTLMRSTFDDALGYFENKSIDLLHIDGRHRYEDVQHDYESWLPKLTDNAVVLLHDTNVRERNFGVWKFFQELSGQHPSFQFIHGHGLGLVCPGPVVPAFLEELAHADAESADVTRRTYASLGRSIADRQRLMLVRQALDLLSRPEVDVSADGLSVLRAASGDEQGLIQVGARLAKSQTEVSALQLQLSASEGTQRESASRLAEVRALLDAAQRNAEVQSAEGQRALDAAQRNAEVQSVEGQRALDAARRESEERIAEARDALESLREVGQKTAALQREAEARGVAALVSEKAAWDQADQSSVCAELMRRIIRGRDHKLARVRDDLERAEAAGRRLTGEVELLRSLLRRRHHNQHSDQLSVAETSLPDRIDSLSAAPQHQVLALERRLDQERRSRKTAEFRLNAIEHSRAWRAYMKIRPKLGLHVLPAYDPLSFDNIDQHDSLVMEIEKTGLFDAEYYLKQNPDVAEQGIDPAWHFATDGWREQRNPGPHFDVPSYLEQNPDVATLGVNPLLHYVYHGQAEGRRSSPVDGPQKEPVIQQTVVAPTSPGDAVLNTGLFDPVFYVSNYPDVAEGQIEPALHYAMMGWREGRNPHESFDTTFYVEQNQDVAAAGINPLVHYASVGAVEGRTPMPREPVRSTAVQSNVEALAKDNMLVVEIEDTGLFDEEYYLTNNPDIASLGINPILHFAREGWREGRKPNSDFDPNLYLALNADVAAEGINPLLHFAKIGASEGRKVSGAAVGTPNPVELQTSQTLPVGPASDPVDADAQVPGSARGFDYSPTISIITPVYNIDPTLLRKAVESVQAQTYPFWEMCLCDDGSSSRETIRTLTAMAKADVRLRVARHDVNKGISTATNTALSLAKGDFVAFLDNDDELVPEALEVCVRQLNRDRDIDILYSDEDKLNSRGETEEPFFKPDWSPSLLREVMYIGHLLVIRRSLVEKIGGLDKTYDGVQDFELALRASEHTDRIFHIREILYHWRRIPGSIADDITAKPKLGERQVAAVNAHLQRVGVSATAHPHPALQHRAVLVPHPRAAHPRISIIIVTKDQPQLIGRCLDSIYDKTSYPDFEVVVVDNGTTDHDALRIIASHPVISVPFDEVFNYSRGNNVGVRASSGEILVFLNNDTEVLHPDWLSQMLFLMDDTSVAAVGPMLTYPDGTVQHAGVALGMRGTADHVLRGLPSDADGYFGSLACTREVSAVTFACAMVRRRDYDVTGGLSEFYATHYQDVDVCLRLKQAGKRILYTPRTQLVHHESATRGPRYDAIDRALLLDSWGDVIGAGDPYARWEPEARSGVKAS